MARAPEGSIPHYVKKADILSQNAEDIDTGERTGESRQGSLTAIYYWLALYNKIGPPTSK